MKKTLREKPVRLDLVAPGGDNLHLSVDRENAGDGMHVLSSLLVSPGDAKQDGHPLDILLDHGRERVVVCMAKGCFTPVQARSMLAQIETLALSRPMVDRALCRRED